MECRQKIKKLNNIIRVSVLVFGFLIGSSHASLTELSSWGAVSGGLAGSGVSGISSDALSMTLNPAHLSTSFSTLSHENKNQRLQFTYGLIFLNTQLDSLSNITLQNSTTADATLKGDLHYDIDKIFGQIAGANYLLSDADWRPSLGFNTYLPINSILSVDSGEAYQPEYPLYRSRYQRPQVEIAFSGKIRQGIQLGMGLHIGTNLNSKGIATLQTDSQKPSQLRLISKAETRAAPSLGILLYDFNKDIHDSFWSFGFTTRLPLENANRLTIESQAYALLGADLGFNFSGKSALFYDPLTLTAGTTLHYLPTTKLILELQYAFWSQYQSPTIEIVDAYNNCVGSGCGFQITKSNLAPLNIRNILIPRLAHEWTLRPGIQLRCGYSYKPSIFKSVPSASNSQNFLDPAKHTFSLGAGVQVNSDATRPISLDFYTSLQTIRSQSVTKDQADLIGAPGYLTGGKILGGGVSLNITL